MPAFAVKFGTNIDDMDQERLTRRAARAIIEAYEASPEAITKGAEAVLDYFCQPGRINRKNRFGMTPLGIAVQYDSAAAVKELIKRGATVNFRLSGDARLMAGEPTILELACFMASDEVVDALLDSGRCNLHFRNDSGYNTFHELAAAGRSDRLKYLIERCRQKKLLLSLEHFTPEERRTALALACVHGKTGCAAVLIDKGADMDVRDVHGNTPLALACKFGNPECVALLIDKGATTDVVNNAGLTPLAIACEEGEIPVVRTLFDKGVAVDTDALVYALRDDEVAQLVATRLKTQRNAPVVFHGALVSVRLDTDFNFKNYARKIRLVELGTGILTPAALNHALYDDTTVVRGEEAFDYCRRYFQVLIDAGANPKTLVGGETLLTHLVKEYYDHRKSAGILIGSLYMMYQTLVNLGADPSIPNTNGETPLDLVENFYRDNPALDKFLAKAASGTPLPDW